MAKKKPSGSQPWTSRDLVPVGPRYVQTKYHNKRDENGHKPSTSRALVLRDGKYGVCGTGEVMLSGRITGREKLDLLAEDLVSQKSRTALMAPLDFGRCFRIADSQCNAYLDDISELKHPDTFYSKIVSELFSRMRRGTQGGQYSLRDASHIASVVSTRIHNAYMIASGWRLVANILLDLQNSGLKGVTARPQLQIDGSLRSRYLALCDIVGVLVDLGQAHFSILAMTAPHYSRYFKEVENVDPGEPSIAFDWASLKDACKSFLDSIIIELSFPRAPYPRRILYQILHDAVDESPAEAQRFPQSLWDAVGDLSVSLELQELLESPLLGPEGERLKALPRQMPEQYELWLDAQMYSRQASSSYSNFKDLISPLERTKDPSVLDNMWRLIDLNYKSASGLSLGSLWQLDQALHRTPQWSSIYAPNLRTYDSDSDSERRSMRLLKSGGRRKIRGQKGKKPLAITDYADDGSDGVPGLLSTSDSSSESSEDGFVPDLESDSEEESNHDDEESNYGSEEDELLRVMSREAWEAAVEIPNFFDPKSAVPNFDALVEERKENPFMKLLGSLRGRMFSSDPRLSSTTSTEPRNGRFGRKRQTAKASATRPAAPVVGTKITGVSGKVPTTQPTPSQPAATPKEPKDYRATVDDADEEEVSPVVDKKKKKKPKKKKKKEATNGLPTVYEDCVPAISAPLQNLASSTVTTTPAKPLPDKPGVSDAALDPQARMSTSSLRVEPTHAQSTHSYLQGIDVPKEKVKSRPNHASIFSDRSELLPRLSSKDKVNEADPAINKKLKWFTELKNKTARCMQQLFRTNPDEKSGSLKWDDFVKAMKDMGFKYDPSTAGSSVRFDPPNGKDRSISIHKPHPKSTIEGQRLRNIATKLKNYYGWSKEDFLGGASQV